jgi:branched-chain amino acid transport system substrate-binding protein
MSLTADYRWGHDNMASWLVNSERYGGEFLGNIYHPLGTRDYSAFIPQILAKKPDFLVLTNYGTDQTSAIKQFAEMGLTKRMKIVISKTHIISIKECGATFDENIYGAVSYYWKLQDKYPESKAFVKAYWDKYGAPPSADGEAAYVATKAVFEAMKRAGTVNDVPKIICTLEGMTISTPKGDTKWRACDHVRLQSVVVLRGKGAKAEGWDVADIAAEVPWQDTLECCYNNRMDTPYGKVKIPGK